MFHAGGRLLDTAGRGLAFALVGILFEASSVRAMGNHAHAAVVAAAAPATAVAETTAGTVMNDAGSPLPEGRAGPRTAVSNDASLPPRAVVAAAHARGDNDVDLILNIAWIRAHPEGPRLGALLLHLPMVKLMAGNGVNPVRDFDAIRVYGPSIWMRKTKTFGIDVRTNAANALVESAAKAFSKRNPPSREWTFLSPTTRAYPARVWGTDAVIVLGKSHTLSIVTASEQADALVAYVEKNARDVPVWADQGLWLRVKDPHGQVAQFPAGADVLELKVETTNDGGANVVIHVVAKTPKDARDLADTSTTFIGMLCNYYTVRNPGPPLGALEDAKIQISGSDLDITVRVTGAELHKLIDYVESFCERHSGCR